MDALEMDTLERRSLIREWSLALSPDGEVCPRDIALLDDLLVVYADGLVTDPFDAAPGRRIGAALADAGLLDPMVPITSARLLDRIAAHDRRVARVRRIDAGRRTAALCAAIGHGHRERLDAAAAVATSAARASYLTEDALRLVLDGAPIAIIASAADGRAQYMNPAMTALVGTLTGSKEIIDPSDFAHPDEIDEIDATLNRLIQDRQGTATIERRRVRPDGSSGWGSFTIVYVRGSDAQEDMLLSAGTDVTERHRLQEELRWQARHDALTGLPNRRHLLERMAAATSTGERVGLCFADLDDFKKINDRYGHKAGDDVLIAVAARLRDSLGDEDCTIARLGGDEFVILVAPPAGDRRVAAIADRLLSSLDAPITANGHRLMVTLSIGVVVTAAAGRSADSLLDAADRGLYRAKAAGGHRWVRYVADVPT